MKKLFESKKFLGITSLVLATSLVVGTIAIRRSKNKGIEVGIPQVNAAGDMLLDYDSASLVNFSTILGRAVDYGIISETLRQEGHMETTFATNKFVNPNAANNCDVDLAGSATAQFIIASLESGSKARFGNTYMGGEMPFVIDTTYDMAANEDSYFVYDDSCKASVLYRTYEEDVLKTNVTSMINKTVKQSNILASKPALDGDTIAVKRGDSGATIDLSNPSFENATIYINVESGSNLEKAIQVADGLLIIKHPSTNIVFNVMGTGEITLTQYRMQIVGDPSFEVDPDNGQERANDCSFDSTTTCSGVDSLHNKHVEEYMTKSVVWNIRNASSVKYNMTAGLFLIPKNIPSNVVGSSAGWIASAGTTTVSSGEFHFIYHDRENQANTEGESVLHFAARKAFTDSFDSIEELTNVKLLANDYSFSFVETESDFVTVKENGVFGSDCKNDAYSKITFPNITVDVKTVDPKIPQKRYFVVKENVTDSVDPSVTISSGEIDIVLTITNIDGIIHYVVDAYKYYTETAKNEQKPDEKDENIAVSGAEFSLGAIYNKIDKDEASLTLKKTLSGETPSGKTTYQIAVKKGLQYVQSDGTLSGQTYYFSVPANDTGITIEGLKPGEYTIIENEGNLQGYNLINTEITSTVTSGDSVVVTDITADGKMTLNADDSAIVSVDNNYEKVDITGKASMTINKMIEIDDEICPADELPVAFAEKEYKFVLSTVDGYETKYVTDFNGTLGSQNDRQVFVVKPGEDLVVYGLNPDWTYIIQELNDNNMLQVAGYNLSGIEIDGTSIDNIYNASNAVQTAEENQNSDVEVVNKYESITSSLVITKEFKNENNNEIDKTALSNLDDLVILVSGPNNYQKTITGAKLAENNWSILLEEVPVGNYEITERHADGTSSSTFVFVDYSVSGSAPTQYNSGSMLVTNKYNTVKTGNLTIQKSVETNGATLSSNDFRVYIMNEDNLYYDDVTGSFVEEKTYVTVPANGTFVTKQIPEGKYTVIEDTEYAKSLAEGYEVSASYIVNNQAGNIVDLKQYGGQCQIKNTYTKYWIDVTKEEAGDHMYNNWTYYFWILDLSKTDGTYYVDQYGKSVRLVDGQDPYYFSIKAGEDRSVKVLLENRGEYKVIEKNENVAANEAFSLKTTYSSESVSLNENTYSAAVTITNTYEYINDGSLSITKLVVGDTTALGDSLEDTYFTVLVKLSVGGKYTVEYGPEDTGSVTFTENEWTEIQILAGQTITIKDIPAGTIYTVEELNTESAPLPDGFTHDPDTQEVYADLTHQISKDDEDIVSITNTYTVATTEATVKKVWEDSGNQDGKRPENLMVQLLADGEPVENKTVTLNEDNGWEDTITDLPMYSGGKEILYTWQEVGMPNGYELTDTVVDGTETTLTNSYEAETMTLSVQKIWDDSDNQDGIRPQSLVVNLMVGEDVKGSVTLNKDNNWTDAIEDLPVYAAGKKIEYTWSEVALPEGYELTTIVENGNLTILTNKHTTEVTSVNVTKVWEDAENQDGYRPESVQVKLLANGSEVDGAMRTLVEDENGEWSYEWT
ncbi:MAG: Cna B-type domain-containing protein, partial [Clostridiales bacterium]|nr:Cna B-type domain-containing protein [Clostridiales bacterium]